MIRQVRGRNWTLIQSANTTNWRSAKTWGPKPRSTASLRRRSRTPVSSSGSSFWASRRTSCANYSASCTSTWPTRRGSSPTSTTASKLPMFRHLFIKMTDYTIGPLFIPLSSVGPLIDDRPVNPNVLGLRECTPVVGSCSSFGY